ncbi:Glyoxylase, beta-lactamase superfamily II [Paenibacillus sp. 1_12]|uniref:MBL fold metallo-hydrolase n=1 Tax=Paenibacillus sp. 1_12 TaxID=1566278 RepID=UPI0008E6F738|nr:MBL fold metallo-hydrolase [Paenibacillus sp. 1_12]SFL14368.1 Glyoxylase, beta-lactamase superfamily II [Paenibacillus sp. 1_12]
MKIAAGLEMLEISAIVMGKLDTIHPILIWDDESAILVDTGYPGQLPKFQEALENAGVSWDRLNHIIITHQDLDHIGSLANILADSPQVITVSANKLEQPYIQGEKQLIKITPEAIELAVSSLPAEVPLEWRKAFRSVLENPPKAQVDCILEDEQELPIGGGVIVIHTPGHTPGHISLFHKPSKTLIAADAMAVIDGQLHGPTPEHAVDIQLATQSLHKFIQYEIENVICYHGGLYRANNIHQRIKELATV